MPRNRNDRGQALVRARTAFYLCSLAQHHSHTVNHRPSKIRQQITRPQSSGSKSLAPKLRQQVSIQWAGYLCPSDFWPNPERKSVSWDLEKHKVLYGKSLAMLLVLVEASFCHLQEVHLVVSFSAVSDLALLVFGHILKNFSHNSMVTLWTFNNVCSILPVFIF